jgi:hypothetical protein
MFVLVDVSAQKILTASSSAHEVGGEWGRFVSSGRAKWVTAPDLPVSDLLVAADGSVSEDPVKKADKEAKAQAKAERVSLIKSIKKAPTLAEVKKILAAFFEEQGYELDAP